MYQIQQVAVLLAICISTCANAGAKEVLKKQETAGHYYLQARSEVGAELLLTKSGTFQWALTYGNVDLFAKGTWDQKGADVTLSASAPPAIAFRLFEADELTTIKPPETGTWVAVVGVPRQGPVAGVEVRFEATSGKVITAVSNHNGDAIADMPASEEWARSGLRRTRNTGEWQWFSVPPERARSRIVGFAINPESITPSPFKTLKLRKEKRGLVIDDGNASFQGLYVKQP
jgi:hypothetical protein